MSLVWSGPLIDYLNLLLFMLFQKVYMTFAVGLQLDRIEPW